MTTERSDEMYWHWYASRFLAKEASLLDEGKFKDWLQLLSPQIEYSVASFVFAQPSDPTSISNNVGAPIIFEDIGSLRTKIKRLGTTHAWAEDPKSATRRFVSNLLIDAWRASDKKLEIQSNLLLFHQRRLHESCTIVAKRVDLLDIRPDGALLARRQVFIDHASFPVGDLGWFL